MILILQADEKRRPTSQEQVRFKMEYWDFIYEFNLSDNRQYDLQSYNLGSIVCIRLTAVLVLTQQEHNAFGASSSQEMFCRSLRF